MCGISGIYSTSENQSYVEKLLNLSLDKLTHRGPDARGIKKVQTNKGDLLLGHTRLSIIDLSKNAAQPMVSANGRYVVSFNGEIYNYIELRDILKSYGYSFNTLSDTEVLLHAWDYWGKDCLSRFKGMFAFSIYDFKRNQLILVRDSFGIKPIYYKLDRFGKYLTFSSELPSLLLLSDEKGKLNHQATFDYLIGKIYDLSEDTFFEDCKSLLPGQMITFNLCDLSNFEKLFWWQPTVDEDININFESAREKIREKFLKNVEYHMRSDVPIGAALSGGIDSSSIVCAMRYLQPKSDIHTFTYVAKDSNENEEIWADEINNFVNAIPHKIVINNKDIVSELDNLIALQGAPFNSSSTYAQYKVYETIREANIRVTLDGQGADEILAGYDSYLGARVSSLISSKNYKGALNLIRKWSKRSPRSARSILVNVIRSLANDKFMTNSKSIIRQNLRPIIDNNWFRNRGVNRVTNYKPFEFNCENPSERELTIQLARSLSSQGLLHLLRQGDRCSMYWSIESRVPFLTNDFVDFCFKLPEEYLISNNGESKYIFREAMRGIVPERILNRKDKIGFSTPENKILNDILPSFREEINIYYDLPFLNKNYLDCIKNNKNIKRNSHLWRFIAFCKWYKLFTPLI